MNALKVLDGAGMDRGITVLAAAYNGRDYIEEQMDSILAQGQGGILLVVSDDGSSDGTGVLLDRYGLKHRDRADTAPPHWFGRGCGPFPGIA